MAVIHIDGTTVEVDGGDNLLQACLSLGIDVPYFCYHPALGSVGSCRQCAVKQYQSKEDMEAGRGRLVMSCMVAPSNDMYISVTDDEAKAFRASMIELLMTNHPHDCPTCEEGGHCHLQDMTYMSGHNHRRYRFTKRTHHNQELGPFIAHEMNRCIACYRCVRFYKDYAGGEDLGVYGSNNRVYFGRDEDGQFESEFSGNLTEVCPTGVFTDKTHSERYNRKWDMQYAPSICHGCSAGCNISPGERYGELRRIENRYNGEVNRYFLCDRGRFGYGYVNRSDRPTQALERINDKHVKISLNYALDETIDRLQGKKVIGIGSPRASLETNFALKSLVGFDNFSTGLNHQQQALVNKCIEVLSTEGIYNPGMTDIESHDAVLILGEDITQTSSRVALSIRQAAKNEAIKMAAAAKTQAWLAEPVQRIGQGALSPIYILDVSQTKLDDVSKVSIVATPEDITALGFKVADEIANLADDLTQIKAPQKLSNEQNAQQADPMQALAQQIAYDLIQADKPLIVSGTSLSSIAMIEAAAQITQVLTQKRTAIKATEHGQVEAHNAHVRNDNVRGDNVRAAEDQAKTAQPTEDKELAAKPAKPETGTNKDAQDDIERAPADSLELKEENADYSAQASIYLTVTDANSMGVCMLGGHSVEELLATDFEVVVVAENQLTDAIDAQKLSQLLSDKTVIALDHQLLDWHKDVDIVLPAASFAEADGTLVSSEGRAQRFFQVYDNNYYHPTSNIKEGWRWLHAVHSSLMDRSIDWLQLDDVISALIATHPKLAGIKDAAPDADYRITGLKIAREPRRYSGRTAMRSPISVHEPMQPKDWDTALTFSMEGYSGTQTPSSMIPFASAAGWNSPQAWNKYQDKVGGSLKNGDPGIRLFDQSKRLATRQYVAPEVSTISTTDIDQGQAKLVPIYNIYASSMMASRSPIVAEQLPVATWRIGTDDASNWNMATGDYLEITVDNHQIVLPIQVVPYLAEGCIGYPVGQVAIIHPSMPASVRRVAAPVPVADIIDEMTTDAIDSAASTSIQEV
ncbi:NADH-quinone oxidoreductase subunit NuoG [Psychrobacter sp. M13]|uniref:NADH-quinone oxidoreductase subunit NuoG n=1 Tax=Psychrobacter sp. M13 TaxID=3067275 RepID=UPI00273C66ED|nr:NADH-quinone oxidoreductase subunit NuoG [Psychrobacter sp. M13]WLP95184.1 NADH-quinone oxidoreductase subunit NuoG [Psychrobacter sp. M13]